MKRPRYDANEHTAWGELISKNFVGGIMWGLGTIIGASLVLSILINGLRKLDFIPLVADMVLQIQNSIEYKK